MSGRPVHLLAAAVAVTASVMSVGAASAGCYSGCGYSYAAPVAYYSAPVVYSYSYAAPVTYAAPCSPCGGYGYGYSYGYAAPSAPMYVVNQGPTYTEPVIEAEPTPAPSVSQRYGYGYGYGSAYPMYDDGGIRWHRRHWGYRSYGYRYGYRSYGSRYGYRGYGYRGYGYRAFGHHRYRYGAVVPSVRYGMRYPMAGGGIYRPRHGMPGFMRPMHRAGVPHYGMMPRGPMHPMMRRKRAMP